MLVEGAGEEVMVMFIQPFGKSGWAGVVVGYGNSVGLGSGDSFLVVVIAYPVGGE